MFQLSQLNWKQFWWHGGSFGNPFLVLHPTGKNKLLSCRDRNNQGENPTTQLIRRRRKARVQTDAFCISPAKTSLVKYKDIAKQNNQNIKMIWLFVFLKRSFSSCSKSCRWLGRQKRILSNAFLVLPRSTKHAGKNHGCIVKSPVAKQAWFQNDIAATRHCIKLWQIMVRIWDLLMRKIWKPCIPCRIGNKA